MKDAEARLLLRLRFAVRAGMTGDESEAEMMARSSRRADAFVADLATQVRSRQRPS